MTQCPHVVSALLDSAGLHMVGSNLSVSCAMELAKPAAPWPTQALLAVLFVTFQNVTI